MNQSPVGTEARRSLAVSAEQSSANVPVTYMTRELEILGYRAPFIVWGAMFGSLAWIIFFGKSGGSRV